MWNKVESQRDPNSKSEVKEEFICQLCNCTAKTKKELTLHTEKGHSCSDNPEHTRQYHCNINCEMGVNGAQQKELFIPNKLLYKETLLLTMIAG